MRVPTIVILAGGQQHPPNGPDKGRVAYAGRPLIEHVLERLRPPPAACILISADRGRSGYGDYGWPLLPDDLDGAQGPLAGLATALDRAPSEHVLTVPCNAPQLAPDYVGRMCEARDRTGAALLAAHDGARLQPMFALVHRSLAPDLRRFLEQGGRRTGDWLRARAAVLVDFGDRAGSFFTLGRRPGPASRSRNDA
jgi:molybdenum cofactor guanylyltransferase